MKTTIKYLFLSLLGISFVACQKEETVIVQDDNNIQNLSIASPLSSLISRVSQSPTSFDNVIDNCSCFSVQLPVTVIVNSQNITVSTDADYQIVQNAIDAFSNDDDIVNFIYPITVKFQNFQTKILSNKDQLDDILDECYGDDGFDEIDCISVVYPISFNVYNSNNQVASTITINSNSQLYNFLENLDSNVIISLNYPVSLLNSTGATIVINNNSELESFIENSIDDCQSSGGGGNPTFTSILTSGSWHISYHFDDVDDTSSYNGYNFTFNSSGTVIAVNNTMNINGTWSTYVDSGENKFLLAFDGLTLDEIEEDWKITEFTATSIRLKHISGGNGGTDYLYFTKN